VAALGSRRVVARDRRGAADEVVRERRWVLGAASRPAILDRVILALHIATLLQPLEERRYVGREFSSSDTLPRNPLSERRPSAPVPPVASRRASEPRNVAARMVEFRDKPKLNRVNAEPEYDWSGSRRRVGGKHGRRVYSRIYHHMTRNQIVNQGGQSVIAALRPTVFDANIPTFIISPIHSRFG
jgi:hypothetical protein